MHPASLESYPSLFKVVQLVQPDECYHLAAQSFVSYAFDDEFSTLSANINGTHFLLSALKEAAPHCRFYFAASSEVFGKVRTTPQSENTPFYPRSAYGISKVAGFDLTRNFREDYGMHATSGILYNHEGPRAQAMNSSPGKSPATSPGSNWAWQKNWCWGTSTPSATGATPGTTSTPCGSCSSNPCRTITSSPQASPTASASFWRSPSAAWAWITATMPGPIPSSSAARDRSAPGRCLQGPARARLETDLQLRADRSRNGR